MREDKEIGTRCAYCAKTVLDGLQRPEHPLPAAAGSSFETRVSCDSCNTWAGVEIDQPFLRDDWVLIHRAMYDVRDPRRPERPVRSPLKRGHTDDGVYVTVDDEWRPHLHGRIFRDSDNPDVVRIIAGSQAEADRLVEKIRREATAEGKGIRIDKFRSEQIRPWIRGGVVTRPGIWLRMAAKIALGTAAHAYPPEWRDSEAARTLRRWMHEDPGVSDEGEPIGFIPKSTKDEPLLREIVQTPEHLLGFTGAGESTMLFCVLFGALAFSVPVDAGNFRKPRVAWLLDPRRPNKEGETTFDDLIMRSLSAAQLPKRGIFPGSCFARKR